ncbi:hypothetical protein BDR22DRAFT_978094 [Usnea florida]
MGGRAFLSGPKPLNVVRLQPKQYIELRDYYQRILLKFYSRVVVPPEAPEKVDHGDIDVLVDESLFNFAVEDLKQALGAEAHMKTGCTNCFAIQLSEDDDKYFQLDIQTCKKGSLEWASVIYGYGDIWHIIGSTVTRFDLTIDDSGLHARVKKMEGTSRKDRRLFLTSDPQEMMDFLGLDGLKYEQGFSNLDELFDWAVAMPFFQKKIFQKESTSADQQRIREKRPMYAKFVEEWLPQAMSSNGRVNEDKTTVTSIDVGKNLLNKALLRFQKREDYERLVQDQRKVALKDEMWKKIARLLPLRGKELGQAMVALKATLWWNDGNPTLRVESDTSVERIPALDTDVLDELLLPWIEKHWREAVRLSQGEGS